MGRGGQWGPHHAVPCHAMPRLHGMTQMGFKTAVHRGAQAPHPPLPAAVGQAYAGGSAIAQQGAGTSPPQTARGWSSCITAFVDTRVPSPPGPLLAVHQKSSGVKSGAWWLEFLLTILSIGMHLMIMLLIMSYNAWVLIICVLGYGAGFLCIDIGQK